MKPADVLLLTTENETVEAVRTALESTKLVGPANRCKNIVELRAHLSKPAPDAAPGVAIVDIDGDPHQILFDLGKVTAANPNFLVVIVSKRFSEKLVLQAMQAGSRHFLRKSAIAVDLNGVIEQLLHENHAPARLGDVISVFSCSGGCGATTVGVNLAVELRLASEERVLLVDLDPHYGSAAHHLNVTGHYGIAHVLNRTGTIDRHLIESVATRSADGVDVLLSPAVAQADASLPMHGDNLLRVLDACRESHGYVVVDAPRVSGRVLANLTPVTKVAVIVFQLTVRDLAVARTMVSRLLEQGTTADHIVPLANRVSRRGPMLKVGDAQRALGIGPLYCIRSDWRRAINSLNRGQPLVYSAPRSGLRKDFRKIVRQVQLCTRNGYSDNGEL